MNVKEFNKLKAQGVVNKQGRLQFAPEATIPSGEAEGTVAVAQRKSAENGSDRPKAKWELILERDKAQKPKQHHVQHEDMMQMQILKRMEEIYPQYYRLLVHNANENKSSTKVGAKRREMGVRKGMPDLSFFVPSPYYHGLHIELKYGYNKQSEEQKMYQKLLEEQGYQYVVCKSVEDFFKGINQYILLGRWG